MLRSVARSFVAILVLPLCAAAAEPASPASRPATPAIKPVTAASKPVTAASRSAATLDVQDSAKIGAAIKALSADSWKERQAAQDTLVGFGSEVVGRLQDLANAAEDEEVRTRAAAALRQIEEGAEIGGSVVTIHVKDARPQDVFEQLGKQARCEFPTYPGNLWQQQGVFPATVTMDLERVNFWTAFKEACQKSGVTPQQIGNGHRMSLCRGTAAYWNGPSVVTGPFMVVANRVYRSNSIDLASPANVQRDFSLGLSAFAEPKIHVIQSSYNVNVEEAVDDHGNSLASSDRIMNGMSSGQQFIWNLSARLAYPAHNPGTRIARFKGSVKFTVQTKSQTLDVPEILNAKNLERTVAGRRIVIKQAKKNGDQYELQMTIYRDQMGEQEWSSMQYPGYALRLLDKDGKALSSRGWGGGFDGKEMNYNWNFARDAWGGEDTRAGEPFRLVWEIPTQTREMEVRFEFKDLPIP
ncbi:MAG TPA: HEAT repeat domain-containing protein [Tepidisphaeraceae bacterium]|jgi:hypothetical protein